MKRILALFLAVITVLSLTSCGLISDIIDIDVGGNHVDTGGNSDNGEFPRFTGYDNSDPTYAALANCKMVFKYDYRMYNGNYEPEIHAIECTFMACLDRCYVQTYKDNFDEYVSGKSVEADTDLAFVIEGNTVTQYDFYRKIVTSWEADEYSNSWYPYYPDFGEDWVAVVNCMSAWPYSVEYGGTVEKKENIQLTEMDLCGITCKGVEQRQTIIADGVEYIYKNCVFYYDPDSRLPLYYQYYGFGGADPFPVITMEEFGVNCVRQSDIDAIVAEKYTAHKDEYRTMTPDEYNNYVFYGEEP